MGVPQKGVSLRSVGGCCESGSDSGGTCIERWVAFPTDFGSEAD